MVYISIIAFHHSLHILFVNILSSLHLGLTVPKALHMYVVMLIYCMHKIKNKKVHVLKLLREILYTHMLFSFIAIAISVLITFKTSRCEVKLYAFMLTDMYWPLHVTISDMFALRLYSLLLTYCIWTNYVLLTIV